MRAEEEEERGCIEGGGGDVYYFEFPGFHEYSMSLFRTYLAHVLRDVAYNL